MCDNVRGIKSKINSLKGIIEEEKPAIIGLTETKLKDGDSVAFEDYVVKRADRAKNRKGGGGVLFAYHRTFSYMMKVVNEEREKVEMLWIRLDNNVVKARIGVVYMPQESETTVKELKEIYDMIEEEVAVAAKHGERLILMGDFNCKVGNIIQGNDDIVSKGGKILLKMVNKYNLCILNGEKCCKGKWTRIEGEEKSILDYIIINQEDKELYTDMYVDEDKQITPYNVEQELGGVRFVYSDHCMIRVRSPMQLKIGDRLIRREKFDRKRREEFAMELEREKVSEILDSKQIITTYGRWSDKVMEISEKFRVKSNTKRGKSKSIRLLMRSKHAVTRQLKTKMVDKEEIQLLKKRKLLIMEHIDEERMKENNRKVEKVVQEVKEDGGVNSATFWKVKRRLTGRNNNELAAILDEEGRRTEEPDEIKGVYMRYFQNLLETKGGETEEEKKREELVHSTIATMENISVCVSPQSTNVKEIKQVVDKLDVKKAKDRDDWSNEIVVSGGEEMLKSLDIIIGAVDSDMCVPGEWNKMGIKTTDKKRIKLQMENKRGLFMTNIISKIYERVVKGRNETAVKIHRSPWQMGGEKKRSPGDNLFITYSVIERNQYLGKPTYIFYADAEKCFDKMWLEDAIIELWRQGTNIRDAIMIKKMNEVANIIIHTPVGDTEEIMCKNIVRQGTVYGPKLCGVSMSRVNDVGRDIVTMYGPNLVIKSTQFVDDVSTGGSARSINNTIYNCNRLEDSKKMTFNNSNGKTEYTIVNPSNGEEEIITATVKNGFVKRVKEHKSLGLWIDEKGTYSINNLKNKTRIPHMVAYVKAVGSACKMGKMAIQARIKLMDSVIMKSLMHEVEVVPQLTGEEMRQMESMQHKILSKLLEVPISTPYMGLLLETGVWTMKARVDYRKLMLFHNIKHSEDDRIIKKIVSVQEKEVRTTTWIAGVREAVEYYGIVKSVDEVLKSGWKKHVKERITSKVEEEIREKCRNLKKTRSISEDNFELKDYLKDTTLTEANDILKVRLHMTKLPCNYGSSSDYCHLCGFQGKVESEHYFEQCQVTKRLANIWETQAEDLKGSIEQLKKAKNHLKKVEIMMERYMPF